VSFLEPRLGSFVTVDQACTAKMLYAAALARGSGERTVERGLALLEAVEAAALELGAHRVVRGKIAYLLASVHWLKRDYAAVSRYAVIAERARADVVTVRAVALRGYVALAQERYRDALELFRSALRAYRACNERDADLVLGILVQIASLEVTLRSASVVGTHALPDGSGRVDDDAVAKIPGVLSMQIASMDACLYAFDGERRMAYRYTRLAERLAPNDAWRVFALANRAKISFGLGDYDWAVELAADALELAERVDWDASPSDERMVLLHLTEILARTDPPAAVKLFRRYDRLTADIDRARLLHDDARLWICDTFVRALIHRLQGESALAYQAFEAVHAHGRRVGIVWRQTAALIEMDAIGTMSRHERPLQTAVELIRENFPRSFLARRVGRWSQAFADPVAMALAPQPREVLRYLLSAMDTKKIAAVMRLSEHTVKQYICTLFRAFDVHSKEELLVACYERGIGSPAWWNALDDKKPLR
jgi:DNA-binding NarL/FixJ family response regulator